MTALDLTDEYVAAVNAITDADIEYLEGLGVPPEIASGLLPDYPVLGKVRIQTFDSDWSYQPAPDGEMYYVYPYASGLCIEDVGQRIPTTLPPRAFLYSDRIPTPARPA